MKLSIVATLFKSAEYIEEFYQRSTKVARQFTGEDYEIVLVNDGSPDNSLDLAVELTQKDSHVVVVDLSRNFGHHKAMMAGLAQATGELIFLIDTDLEEDPDWLLSFSEQMSREKCDVVYGEQKNRKGGLFERLSGRIYYWALNLMLNMDHPKNITTARLMTKRYVNALLLYTEREIIISGLWVLTGFKQQSFLVEKKSTSKTTYSFFHKISHLINVVTSFSSRPLIGIFLTGAVISAIALGFAFFLVVNRLFFSVPLDGWTSVMISIWLLGGIIISFIGVIGIYLSKIFQETKQRPQVIVKEVHGHSKR